MNKRAFLRALTRQVTAARTFALAAVLGVWALPSHAASSSAQFNVTINLNPPSTAVCRSSTGTGASGATATVVCATGTNLPATPVYEGTYRFMTQGGELSGIVDSYTGACTFTSWRVVKLADRDYLEMIVGW